MRDPEDEPPIGSRTVLVTGGGRRLGAAISVALAARGARVVVHYARSEAEARDTAARCAALRGGAAAEAAIPVAGDLREAETAERLLESAAAAGFEVDAVIHAAASFLRRPPLATTAEEWDEVFAINLRAFHRLAVALAARRRERGGDLVAISDSGARELWTGYLAHCVSKAALLDLVRALAKAMAPRFRVNAVVPGPVLPPEGTPLEERERMAARTLLRRIGRPADVARAVEFLLGSPFVTGAIIDVTGGAHLWRPEAPGGAVGSEQ